MLACLLLPACLLVASHSPLSRSVGYLLLLLGLLLI
jgi:hypothetical protein